MMARLKLVAQLAFLGCFIIAGALALASCAQDIRQEAYTTDDSTQVRSDVLNSDLSDDQKKSFNTEIMRDGYQPYGKTVSTILEDAQRDEASDRAAAAAVAERTRALDNDLKIYPSSISVVKGGNDIGSSHFDDPLKDEDTFIFLVRNSGSREISGFSADATLTNEGGEVLYDGRLNDATILAPAGEEKLTITTTPMDFTALPHPDLVRQASINEAVVHYTVQKIEYSDGSTITRSQ